MKSIGRETLLNRIPQKYKLFIPREKELFTALDVLNLEGISDELKISVVEITGFIHSDILNEFACRCAERALSRVEHPDPRSVEAIKAKRAWMKGEISDGELDAACDAAWDAARDAARDAADTADAAWDAARAAAWAAAMVSASAAAWAAAWAAASDAAGDAARDAERAWQVEELKKLLMEAQA